MDIWRMESNPKKQTALSIGVFVAGLVLMYLTRNFNQMADVSNGRSGFILGILLAVIGAYVFIAGNKKQTTTIDPNSRNIIVESVSFFRKKVKIINFTEITNITIGRLGKSSNYTMSYYLVLHLVNGDEYSLFPAGYFYEGEHSESAAEEKRNRLQEYINS